MNQRKIFPLKTYRPSILEMSRLVEAISKDAKKMITLDEGVTLMAIPINYLEQILSEFLNAKIKIIKNNQDEHSSKKPNV